MIPFFLRHLSGRGIILQKHLATGAFILTTSLLATLFACSDDSSSQKKKEKKKEKEKIEIAVAPEEENKVEKKEVIRLAYSSAGRRDPFRSFLSEVKNTQKSRRTIQETEKYALDQYRLTAVVTGRGQPIAMVEDPEGTGHMVKLGSRIGRNGGRVSRITRSGITVIEQHRDQKGEFVKVPVSIRLPEESHIDLAKEGGG